MSDESSSNREQTIRDAMNRLRRYASESLSPDQRFSFDVSQSDAESREAALRIVEEDLDRFLAQYSPDSVSTQEVERVKRELREDAERSWK